MNINPDFTNEESSSYNTDAIKEMKGCMDILKELLIDPMIELGHIDADDEDVINAVGFSLQLIAKTAQKFEDHVQKNLYSVSDELNTYEDIFNYRN